MPPEQLHPRLSALQLTLTKSELTQFNNSLLRNRGVELWIKRDDLLHPIISGNKWRKLKYNLNDALQENARTLISMGGPYSNYLHALAYAGKELGLKTIGIIRGENNPSLNPTLLDLKKWGMELQYVSRSKFREYRNYKTMQDYPGLQPGEYWLPEGGSSLLAYQGVGELASEITLPHDVVCVPCGTGATLAGIINVSPPDKLILGFSALKADYLEQEIRAQLHNKAADNWRLIKTYHFGGFAKINDNLMAFMQDFEARTAIPLEPVYTAKMFYGIMDLIRQNFFQPGQRIIAIHTGGLQGKRGYDAKST